MRREISGQVVLSQEHELYYFQSFDMSEQVRSGLVDAVIAFETFVILMADAAVADGSS